MAQLRRYELSDSEWAIIDPLLPRKSRGVPRAEDRRVLNGIFWRLRTGSPWADIPERYGPATTCYNRFVRWRKAGIWDKFLAAVSEAYNGKIQMIDSSVVRVHQHAANGEKKAAAAVAWAVPVAGLRPRSTRSSTRAASRSRSS
jgi:transposase